MKRALFAISALLLVGACSKAVDVPPVATDRVVLTEMMSTRG